MGVFEHMLLVVDGTDTALKAAEYSIELARAFGCKLTAVGVVDTETLRTLMTARILVAQEMQEFEADLERSHHRHLDFVRNLAQKANLQIDFVLRKGVMHSAVLAEQKARGCDVIVIGAYRPTITKIDLVARERQLVLEEAPCPVLVVR